VSPLGRILRPQEMNDSEEEFKAIVNRMKPIENRWRVLSKNGYGIGTAKKKPKQLSPGLN